MSTNLNTFQNHVISLAGLFQACTLVSEIAHTGKCNREALHTSLSSVIKTDTDSVQEIFGDCINIRYGLDALKQQLDTTLKPNIAVTHYAISLLHLQKKLSNNPKMISFIADELSKVSEQLKHFEVNHPNIIAKLADIYQKSISQLGAKILIKGEKEILANQDNANKIRALLLAGIRSAVLFRQCKGSKFKLLLKRKHYLDITNNLLSNL